jgi:hypothetical protein
VGWPTANILPSSISREKSVSDDLLPQSTEDSNPPAFGVGEEVEVGGRWRVKERRLEAMGGLLEEWVYVLEGSRGETVVVREGLIRKNQTEEDR